MGNKPVGMVWVLLGGEQACWYGLSTFRWGTSLCVCVCVCVIYIYCLDLMLPHKCCLYILCCGRF